MTADIQGGLEREVLGSLLLRGDRWPEVADVLNPKHFRSRVNQLVFEAVDAMSTEGGFIDALSVAKWMVDAGHAQAVQNGAYLTELAAECSGVNLIGYARQLRDQAVARETKELGRWLAESDGGTEARDRVLRELLALDVGTASHEHTLKEALSKATDDLMESMASDSEIRGITSGFRDIDKHLSGLNSPDLIVVGARPAMGKTSLLLQMTLSAAKAGHRVGLISAEQPYNQVGQRHQANEGRVSLASLRAGRISDQETDRLMGVTKQMMSLEYRMFDRSNPDIGEVVRVARKWKQSYGLEALYVDYLQRIRGRGKDKTEQVGDVAVQLKNLARDLDIRVVTLCQVNREVEKRPNKRPSMGDLRNSGEIEQEADQILMLYRDEVYYEDTPDKGIAEISIEKNRHGYIGTVRTAWNGEFVRFDDLARGPEGY